MADKVKKVLAVSSSGGHWVQLMRLRPAWDNQDVAYLTTEADYRADVDSYAEETGQKRPRFYTTVVATRWQKFRLIRQLLEIAWVVVKERPNCIITTGAAPGFFALQLGRLFGAKTVWIDSIANVQELSLSGQKARSCASAWLTQWPHLAKTDAKEADKPDCWGSVI